jgi:hypothetical protein
MNPSSYVTVQPVPGQTATVNGVFSHTGGQVNFLRFQGLKMTAGFDMESNGHDLQFINNDIGNTLLGVYLQGISTPITNVLIQGNYMHGLDFPNDGTNGPGGACVTPPKGGGQGVTVDNADGVTISHNTFQSIAWHYIQGSGSTLGMMVNNNLFEGPFPADAQEGGCSHLNIWQIFDGGSNDSFKNNIVKGAPGSPAGVTPILFESGVPSPTGPYPCTDTYINMDVENNLFLYSSTAYVVDILTTTNLTYSNNTVVGGDLGVWLDRADFCGAGTNLTAKSNVTANITSGAAFTYGACNGTCIFDQNVSDDGSANLAGSTHYATGWTPAWQTTTWDPTQGPAPPGYYQPTRSAFTGSGTDKSTFQAGYQGAIGP